MNCPKCRHELYHNEAESGVTVQFCSPCKGMFLKRGDLAKLSGTPSDVPDGMGALQSAQPTSYFCPQPACNAGIEKHPLVRLRITPDASFEIDYCRVCQGIWLDSKELPLAKVALQSFRIRKPRPIQTTFSKHAELFSLENDNILQVRQVFELAEFFGFETRNKYEILNSRGGFFIYAVEQGRGLFGILFRQLLGHWRPFTIHFFDENREKILTAHHPFRWWFHRLDILDPQGNLVGFLQQRFTFFSRRFDIHDSSGQFVMMMRSPFFRIWTFPFFKQGQKVAQVEKNWSGFFREAFTDGDRFTVDYLDENLLNAEKLIIMAAALFIDLSYFERKAGDS